GGLGALLGQDFAGAEREAAERQKPNPNTQRFLLQGRAPERSKRVRKTRILALPPALPRSRPSICQTTCVVEAAQSVIVLPLTLWSDCVKLMISAAGRPLGGRNTRCRSIQRQGCRPSQPM